MLLEVVGSRGLAMDVPLGEPAGTAYRWALWRWVLWVLHMLWVQHPWPHERRGMPEGSMCAVELLHLFARDLRRVDTPSGAPGIWLQSHLDALAVVVERVRITATLEARVMRLAPCLGKWNR